MTRFQKSSRLLGLAGILGAAASVYAQWTKTTGPDSVQTLASGSIVIGDDVLAGALVAGTNHGVYVSTDGGTDWFLDNGGLPSTNIASVAVAFLKPYIAPMGGGVYMSENEGTLWQPRNEGLTDSTVQVLASSPSQLQLYAGTDEGVFRTANSDNVWVAVHTGLPDVAVHALVVSDSFVYAGTDSGVFRSGDQGESWTNVNTGLTATTVRVLALSPSAVIAAMEDGVFRSLNHGAEWTAADSGLGGFEVHALTQYAGTFFAGTDSGVFVSADHGSSWAPVNAGLTSLRARALTAYGENLYAGADSGLWRRPLSEFLPSPDGLFYSPDSFSYSDGIIESWNPSVAGAVTQWTVSPALPAGMRLNARTGIITGVPEEIFTNWRSYTITAANASGSATSVIRVRNFGPLGVRKGGVSFRFASGFADVASFTLPAPGHVSLTAFTPSGRQVAVLLSRDFPAGSHRHRVDASSLPNGLYVFRLQVGGRTESRKVLLTR